MADSEVEEACQYTHYTDAYSSIDEKIETYLGHFQKQFVAGDISAERLGQAFGGYGSFLPPHSHPKIIVKPSIQHRSPPKPPNKRNFVYNHHPDAYSSIDKKIKTYLGHFQKQFVAGDLSAERLGQAFGGYGSFLPPHSHPTVIAKSSIQHRSPPKPPNERNSGTHTTAQR